MELANALARMSYPGIDRVGAIVPIHNDLLGTREAVFPVQN